MKKIAFIIAGFLIALQGFAQKINLAKQNITVFNRHNTVISDGPSIRLDEQPDPGIAWLTGQQFTNGTIEFDVKGKDAYQQSFVGLAFHGTDEHTYEAIYFRPFNFKADDADRKKHAVQYISLPGYDWPKLREAFPNKYEQPVNPSPDPNNWFHVKIVVNGPNISVYVNSSPNPVLTVQQLAKLSGNKIGFWTGNNSGGEWKNLVINPAK